MPDIATALRQLAARQPTYALYNAYYHGDHKLAFATEKFQSAFGDLFRAFADNLCPAIVDAVSDRLEITGFDVESGDESAAKAAREIWNANRMDRYAAEVHDEALKAGDAYVIVWPDAQGRPVIHPNDGHVMTVGYDQETRRAIEWAAKGWLDEHTGRFRLTLYYPDRIEKYVTINPTKELPDKASAFERYEVPGEAWPLPNPWGQVPVFHFPNAAKSGRFGVSELKPVIPLQDGLNKAVADMLIAAEFVAMPQRWVTGIEIPTDPETGKPVQPWKAAVDRVWATADPDVRFGQFPSGDLKQYLDEQESFRLEIARVSRTPIHYLLPSTGQFPSGEALRTAETPFVAKIKRRQVSFGNAWEDVLRFALRIANGPDAQLSINWLPADARSRNELMNELVLKQSLGVPPRQLWSEAGYSEEQIAKMEAEFPGSAPALNGNGAAFDRGFVG